MAPASAIHPAIWFILGAALGLALAVPYLRVRTKRLIDRARAAERRARDARRLAEIGAMTGGLAHEIKNPLSTIGLNAQLLSEAIHETPLQEDQKSRLVRRIDALRREAERLRDILADFLRFAGSVHLDMAPADLNVVVDEMAEFFLPQAEAAGVRMRLELAPGPIEVNLDATHFKQALLNLLLNGVQAMTREGKDGAPARELILRTEVRKTHEGDATRVHVIDTGPGVPKEKLERVFEPYFTTKSGGTGLGLPTSRRLIEEHGGTIEVHSDEGRGADFVITLPLRLPAAR
ncbi:MAG: two-component system sensor histidine kinase NtrB [Phycisphaerales bacterium]